MLTIKIARIVVRVQMSQILVNVEKGKEQSHLYHMGVFWSYWNVQK